MRITCLAFRTAALAAEPTTDPNLTTGTGSDPRFFVGWQRRLGRFGPPTSQWILTTSLLKVLKGIFKSRMIPNEF